MRKSRYFYRIAAIPALLICLPGILLCLFYTWSAYASFDRYRDITHTDIPFNMEIFHIKLYDLLNKDLKQMSNKGPEGHSKIKNFSLIISSSKLETFLSGAENKNKRDYVPARLEHNGHTYKIEIKIKGQKSWNLLGRKKAMKLKLDKGELIDNNQEFDLINITNPLITGDKIITDIAKESGLLTPDLDFCRMDINGMDMGVFQYNAHADDSLIRKNKRFPGSIYISSLSIADKTQMLWTDPNKWKKESWYDANDKDKRDDLKRLLKYINSPSKKEFADFAENEMNIEKFATLDAIDIIFGSNTHSNRGIHTLYFDPYMGKWEPVADNFDGFKHEPKFNLADNPLLHCLQAQPKYIYLRNSIMNKLLKTSCHPSAVRFRGMKILSALLPDLSTDPYWESYKLLPKVDDFHRLMLRPMNTEQLKLVFDYEMATFANRHSYLVNELGKQTFKAEAPITLRHVAIGPGRIEVPSTLVFSKEQSVEVVAGTTLLMGKDASIVFNGKALFKGTKSNPIIIKSRNNDKWGGIAFHGQATTGSSMEYVKASGGTIPKWRSTHYPGMINIHDTSNITIRDCDFFSNHLSDMLHIVYVKNLFIKNCIVKHAAIDAFDIEYCNGILENIRTADIGDDGVDLMGSDIKLRKSILLSCKGNGLSVGQETDVLVRDTIIADSRTGILVKSASSADISGNLLYANKTGLHVFQRDIHYQGKNTVKANVLFVLKCDDAIKNGDKSESVIDINSIQKHLQKKSILKHFLNKEVIAVNGNELGSLLKDETEKERQ